MRRVHSLLVTMLSVRHASYHIKVVSACIFPEFLLGEAFLMPFAGAPLLVSPSASLRRAF